MDIEMQRVQGRTKRIGMPAIRYILPLLLLASCQMQPSRELPPETRVAVLATGYSQHEKHLQEAIKNSLGDRGEVLHIQNADGSMREVSSRLTRNKYSAVVVLDSGAVPVARKLQDKRIYFGQSFDYKLADQMGERFRGVSIVPEAKPVFRILRSLDNRPKTIGIIAGPNLQPMIELFKKQGRKFGYRIEFRQVGNDREFLYQAKRVAKDVDIYWLMPDSRVLSGIAITQFMRWSVKENKPVISFTPSLLKLGALMSVRVDDNSVAVNIRQLLEADLQGRGENRPEMRYVKDISVHISKLSAKRLGIVIPTDLKRYMHD